MQERKKVKKFEKIVDEFISDPTKMAEFVTVLSDELSKVGVQVITETLEGLNQYIKGSGKSKAGWLAEANVKK